MVGPTYYNTMTGGMNDNNIVVGYYIDGSDYIPYSPSLFEWFR